MVYFRNALPYFFATIASLGLSFWIAAHQAIINPDAICYLESAKALHQYGLAYAMQLCSQANWPFYSMIIASFVQLTGFTYSIAAYVIDGLFSMLSVSLFLLIVRELGGTRRTVWLAALVILLAGKFNGVRHEIVRDHGFWAFYLSSVFFLLGYFKNYSLKHAFLWGSSLLIASLFRVEGSLFLILLPFLAWIDFTIPIRQRLTSFLNLYFPFIMIILALAIWLLMHPHQSLAKIGRIHEIPDQLQHGLGTMIELFQKAKMAISRSVLVSFSQSQAGLVLMITIVIWYLLSIIINLSWIYSCLMFYAMRCKTILFSSVSLSVLWGYIAVNVLITFAFLLEHFFLSKRYLIALSLILMLWVPFALDELWRKWRINRGNLVFPASIIFIILFSLGGIFNFGHSKAYIREAGEWLALHVPAEAALYMNDPQLIYYSKHFEKDLFQKFSEYPPLDMGKKSKRIKYDYIALRMKRGVNSEEHFFRSSRLTPIRQFSNKQGDRVSIYKLPWTIRSKVGIDLELCEMAVENPSFSVTWLH